jgi:predicted Zn-dependent protease
MNALLKRRGSACALAILLALTGCDLFTSSQARIARAQQEMSQGDFRAAAIDLRNVLKKRPTDAETRMMLATLLLKLGDADTAQRELARAVHDGADPSRSAHLTAEIQLRLGQHSELVKQIDDGKLSLVEPERSTRGYALSGLGKPVEAADAFDMPQVAPGALRPRLDSPRR